MGLRRRPGSCRRLFVCCASVAGLAVCAATDAEADFGAHDFDYHGCTRFLHRLDWNQNITEEQWRVRFTMAVNCMRHNERLAREADGRRPAAISGIHVPTAIVPTHTKDLPELPPFYFVLPIWDMVVSNQVRLNGAYDVQELDVLLRLTKPGDTFVDIGANVGAVTVPLAAHVGREGTVYSFEPFRQVFQYLNANVATNGLENVHTFHCALSDSYASPQVRVPAPSLTRGMNVGMYGVFKADSLEPNDPLSSPSDKLEDISVRTLDSFELPRVDVIKIDVEGHAPRVLAGSIETLKAHRPMIWFEQSGNLPPEALLLPELQYKCTKLLGTTEDQFLCGPQEHFTETWQKLNGIIA